MKKINFCALLLAAAFLCAAVPPRVRALENPDVPAQAVLLAEAGTGAVLYGKNEDERRAPDTMTKIMTLLLAAEAAESGAVSIDETVTASAGAWFDITPQSETRDLLPGEELRFFDLLCCAYIGGANEACNIIAERVADSVPAFVARMNERARALGCEDTSFTNTHGQADPKQYTTARDLCRIMRAAAECGVFLDVAGTYKYKTAETNMSAARELTNSNYLLGENSRYYYSYCTAGKVSATYESGYGCAAAAQRDGLSLIAVVLGAKAVILEDQSTQMQNLTGTRSLFEWGFEGFGWRTVISTSELIAKAPVTYGDGADYVNLRAERDVTLLLPAELAAGTVERAVTVYSVESGETLTAPVRAGETLGELTLFLDGQERARVALVANTSVDMLRIKYIETQVREALHSKWARWITASVAALFAVYAALVVRYNVLRRRRIKRIKEAKRKIADERRNQ
ncbi:MAG: D-alanyl-D-alanine carboxypeptidase [Oscillospiraceae bacterium]|jgi:D-alanyl-D-alanine carboxypeptidase (penicillin-binding protein 5/6)|nr:D-alanyl-D-alanine carboxypeptidase [Oscillospiraceae bacterium]